MSEGFIEALRQTFPSTPERKDHVSWALAFLLIAITAGLLGFTGIAGTAAGIAKILFFVFLVLLIITAIASAVRGRPPV